MRCPACGEEVVAAAVYCHKCGHRLSSDGDGTSGAPSSADVASSAAGAFQQGAAAHWEDKDKPEEELWQGSYSSKAMIGSWAMSGCVSILLLLIGIFWVRDFTLWLLLVLAMVLPWLYFLAVLAYRRMSVRYVLSTQRFLHERGFLRRVSDRIELLDVDDITFEQSLWERLVGFGTLRIASHDRTNPELVLPGIENIKHVASLFDDARLAERRRRGLHVEQI
ncbi:MAG: PH domain-containing protein [Thermoguttaceae bacterium]|jgi:hypothetical protein